MHVALFVELILAQPRTGTTIKTGDAGQGEEGDLYAVPSVVIVNVHLQGNGCGLWLSMSLGRWLRVRREVRRR